MRRLEVTTAESTGTVAILRFLRHRACAPRARWLTALAAAACTVAAAGHGGVFLEDDLCVVQIGFLRAHFTIYQPQTRANEEFCEDVPDVTETVFVMDYLHQALRAMPVDFRIVRDVQNLGRFARWEDLAPLGDLAPHTVFYQPPVARADAVFEVAHTFAEPGGYIGIVTARSETSQKLYRAVFPFEVGGTGFGWWPVIAALAVAVQTAFWIMGGGLTRWRARRAERA